MISGPCSSFGGIGDKGMSKDSGLALYEPWEANLRPDIFLPEDPQNPLQPTWQRLRVDFPYLAMRFSHALSRHALQLIPWKLENPKTKHFITGFLVDWGPSSSTGRVVDVSPGIMSVLNLKTDDVVVVYPVI